MGNRNFELLSAVPALIICKQVVQIFSERMLFVNKM